MNDVRAADEAVQFDVIGHLPREAQEALLKLAVGEKPKPPTGVVDANMIVPDAKGSQNGNLRTRFECAMCQALPKPGALSAS